MPKPNAGYPNNFRVDSGIFKDDESETEAKTKENIECIHSWSEVRFLHIIYI